MGENLGDWYIAKWKNHRPWPAVVQLTLVIFNCLVISMLIIVQMSLHFVCVSNASDHYCPKKFVGGYTIC